MSFYGYTPQTPDLSGIERAGQSIGSVIAAIPGKVRQKKHDEANLELTQRKFDEFNKGVEAAKKDWDAMQNSVKSFRNIITKKGKTLIEKGLLSQDQLEEDINMLPLALNSYKKDIPAYLKLLGNNYNTLLDKYDKKLTQLQIGEKVTQAISGQPGGMVGVGEEKFIETAPGEGFTEQNIEQLPAVSMAETQEQAAQRLPKDVTMTQAESVPAFSTLPTEEDIYKRNMDKQKAEAVNKKIAKDNEMDELDKMYKQAQIRSANARTAKSYADIKNAEEMRKQGYDRLITNDKRQMANNNKLIRQLEKDLENLEGWDKASNVEIEEKIKDLEFKNQVIQRHIDEKRARQKMYGAKPGETRQFAPTSVIQDTQEKSMQRQKANRKPLSTFLR